MKDSPSSQTRDSLTRKSRVDDIDSIMRIVKCSSECLDTITFCGYDFRNLAATSYRLTGAPRSVSVYA
jgi:hypothetical protein